MTTFQEPQPHSRRAVRPDEHGNVPEATDVFGQFPSGQYPTGQLPPVQHPDQRAAINQAAQNNLWDTTARRVAQIPAATPPILGRRAAVSAAQEPPGAEPLSYATQGVSGEPAQRYDPLSLRDRLDALQAQERTIPPQRATPLPATYQRDQSASTEVPNYRVRDFSPEGRRGAPGTPPSSWSAGSIPQATPPSDLNYQTGVRPDYGTSYAAPASSRQQQPSLAEQLAAQSRSSQQQGQPYQGQPYQGQPQGQPYQGQPYQGQQQGQPYQGQQQGQPYQGQQQQAQQYPGQQQGQPYQGQQQQAQQYPGQQQGQPQQGQPYLGQQQGQPYQSQPYQGQQQGQPYQGQQQGQPYQGQPQQAHQYQGQQQAQQYQGGLQEHTMSRREMRTVGAQNDAAALISHDRLAFPPFAPSPSANIVQTNAFAEFDSLNGHRTMASQHPGAASGVAQPVVAEVSWKPPVGHWSTQGDLDDDLPEITLNRTIGSGSSATHALVLPSIPDGSDIRGPLTSTGEVMLTGSIDLPRTLSATGQSDRYDRGGIDALFDRQDAEVVTTDSAPVRAMSAVSTHPTGHGITHTQKPKGARALTALIVSASLMAVVVAGLLVAAFAFKIF